GKQGVFRSIKCPIRPDHGIDKLLLVDIDLIELSEYLIVFLSSSSSSLNLNNNLREKAFIARKRPKYELWLQKNGGKELGMVTPQDKSSKKMKFVSSAETETEPTSTTTISEDSKSGRGMSTMPRVVKRKFQKIKPVVEYNKRGKGIGQAHSEMQSYIGVLARSRVPLVDKKWAEIPKDIKEQIWEAVDMAFVVGQGGKNSVLSSAAKKWKDFKSTLTRHYILPYIKDRQRLSQPPETYKFIEKAQWDAFVASRLSKEFQSDQLEETMPGVEIDRSTLWKKARQDKHGNILDPKVAEKAKLIDELQKQVSEGSLTVSGNNDVLTMALGPEHPGRVRGVGAGISPRQYFNLPKPQRIKFADHLKESLRIVLQEETKKMEARSREEALRMEARTKQLVAAEREHLMSQLSQIIPNFDPSMLKPKTSLCQNQSPKNPMSNKASCSGADVIEAVDYSNVEVPSSLQSLCRYVETTLTPQGKIMTFTIEKEVFGADRSTFILPEDITQLAGMEEIGATVVAVYMRPGRKAPIWKTLPGTPKQPSNVECGYYVMRFMRDIIMDPSLEFEKKFAKGKEQAPYPQEAIDVVQNEWAEFVCLHME
ncbi:unnamed protein product, partial [Prunus brigantina]